MGLKSLERREYFDLTYSDEPASYYILSLEVNEVGVKAFWYHRNKNLITGFAEYPFKKATIEDSIEQLVIDQPFLRSDFNQTIVSIRTENYSLVPNLIKEGDDINIFSQTNAFDESTDSLRSYSLINLKARVLFSVSRKVEAAILKAFVHTNFIPHIAPRIEYSLNDLKTRVSSESIQAHVSNSHVDVLIFKDNKLDLCNSFYQTNKEDLAYYILYCSDLLNIAPEKNHLILSGDIDIGDENWKTLSNYWKKLKIAPELDTVEISQKLDIPEPSRYGYLMHSLLCAL